MSSYVLPKHEANNVYMYGISSPVFLYKRWKKICLVDPGLLESAYIGAVVFHHFLWTNFPAVTELKKFYLKTNKQGKNVTEFVYTLIRGIFSGTQSSVKCQRSTFGFVSPPYTDWYF